MVNAREPLLTQPPALGLELRLGAQQLQAALERVRRVASPALRPRQVHVVVHSHEHRALVTITPDDDRASAAGDPVHQRGEPPPGLGDLNWPCSHRNILYKTIVTQGKPAPRLSRAAPPAYNAAHARRALPHRRPRRRPRRPARAPRAHALPRRDPRLGLDLRHEPRLPARADRLLARALRLARGGGAAPRLPAG